MSSDASDLLSVWKRDFERAAEADGYRWILVANGYDPDFLEDGEARGRKLVDLHVETIVMVIAFGSLNVEANAAYEAQIRRFLDLQRYGLEGPESGAPYTLRVLSPAIEISFHVDQLSDVDLQDLHEVLPIVLVEVRSHRAAMDERLAAELVDQVREDLEFDGDEVGLSVEIHKSVLTIDITFDE